VMTSGVAVARVLAVDVAPKMLGAYERCAP
jgi:hypothetical protein